MKQLEYVQCMYAHVCVEGMYMSMHSEVSVCGGMCVIGGGEWV